jgi:Phosphoribosyl transferase domain
MSLLPISPRQPPITDERIMEMLQWAPRRVQLSAQWPTPLHAPERPGRDWCLTLPFEETLANAFTCMCPVDTIGFRQSNGRSWTYLRNTSQDDAAVQTVREWLSVVGRYVAIRDCLAVSFAVEYDREAGDPERPQTEVGLLRSRAKPYDNAPTDDTYRAASLLAERVLAFINDITCYQGADAIVAMPPSDPAKPFDLPTRLASMLAEGLGIPSLSEFVTTTRRRPALKATAVGSKLNAITGTVAVNAERFRGKTVLLLDDLYQSGISLNYVAKLLHEAGALTILGLACEKTCRNDDNV